MAWINPFESNMTISRNIYEGKSSNCLIATAQKIATYLIIPLSIVVFFEAVVKNMIVFTLANLGITIANAIHDAVIPEKKAELPIEDPPAPPAPQPNAHVPAPALPAPNVAPPPPRPAPQTTSYLPTARKAAKYGLAVLGMCLAGYTLYSAWYYVVPIFPIGSWAMV